MVDMNIREELEQLRRRKNNPIDSENDAKASGSNLAPGSAEYREYLMDKKGLDEFEQEVILRNTNSSRSQDNIDPKKDKWHNEREATLASEPVIRREARERSGGGMLSTAERKASHQIRKMYLKDDVEALALSRAQKTESLEDDKAVQRRLPKELDKQIYDDGIQDDDFYPGAKILNKYVD